MKTLMAVVMLATLLVAGCYEQRMTAWGLSAPNNDLTAMVGLENAAGTTEVALVAKCLKTSELDLGQPDLIGASITLWLTQDVTIEDTPEPSIIQPWLEAMHMRPYVRFETVTPIRKQQWQPNWAVGSAFTMEELGDWAIITEYIQGDQVVRGAYVGGRLKF